MPASLDSFRAHRLDEVMGEWKPFFEVVENAIQRACKAHGVDCRPTDAAALYDAIPTWQIVTPSVGHFQELMERLLQEDVGIEKFTSRIVLRQPSGRRTFPLSLIVAQHHYH